MPERADGLDERLIPPGVADARARAFVDVLGRGLDAVPLSRFDLLDFDAVDASLLPALVRGLSMQRYMFPGITEAVVRRLLKHAVPLHVRQGTAAGIRLGLDLIGMRLRLTPWFKQVPMGEPNTFKAVIYINDQIFADADAMLTEANQRAAVTILDATKRWSQQGSLALGAGFTGGLRAANRAAGLAVGRAGFAARPSLSRRNGLGAASRAAALQVAQRPLSASPDLSRRSRLRAANCTAALQVHRMSFEARP